MTALPKPSRTARKKKQRERRQKLRKAETDSKGEVRRRDRFCRFPLCGCRSLGLQLKARPEVSHDKHKGAGGNPSGDRSHAAGMVLLCVHRHQHGAVSIHKGTLRPHFLEPDKFDGPIAWLVDLEALEKGRHTHVPKGGRWFELAREAGRPQAWEPLTERQRSYLTRLAEMEL